MSFVKNKLKIAKDCLNNKDFRGARDASAGVLEYEPENYFANVFFALSLLELGDHGESEQAYLKAIDLNPDQPLAWQGLAKFYERSENWNKYASTLRRLTEIYHNSNDAVKCAEMWQKLVDLHRRSGTRLQLVDTLSLVLPRSPVYSTLSSLPIPDATNPTATTTFSAQSAVHDTLPVILEMVSLLEFYEQDLIEKDVSKGRMRLGAAGPEQLKREIGVELWGKSQLPTLYNDILNHPKTSDDLRREIDAKLLRYKQRYLYALPNKGESAAIKARTLKEIDELVDGVIILGIADELAWNIFLEGKDVDSIASYDNLAMKQFISLFPSSPVVVLLKAYYNYMELNIPDENEEMVEPLIPHDDDPFDTILAAYPLVPNSIIANRVLADVYLTESDYENAIKVAESSLELVLRAEINTGRKLPLTTTAFKVILAVSYVHFFPPKHHTKALHLIDEVLSYAPGNIPCLMGRGFICQRAEKWKEASELFNRVTTLLPDDLDNGIRAEEEEAWCQCRLDNRTYGINRLQVVSEALNNLDGRESDRARCLWRLGRANWELGGLQREESYAYFISALKADSSYAPAFTSLGIYYAEFSSPPDPTRASKCFQKAFELDSREAEAARRLAEGFAEEREWDLVDVVSRRTIEGEGGLEATAKGSSTVASVRYLPANAWAWKALGVVELNRRNYVPAIQAFQVALRAEPEDQMCWLRLGEAYSKAGRHVAAVKALDKARELRPDDWMCNYFIGETQQRMGQFQEAISSFELILETRPFEVGVLVSLAQTYLSLGSFELSEGFNARAEQSFINCIRIGIKTVQENPGFRVVAWKTIADAIYRLSDREVFNDEEKVHQTFSKTISLLPSRLEHVDGIIPPPLPTSDDPLQPIKVLELAAATYSYRITLGGSDTISKAGSAWFDLGMVLLAWAERRGIDVEQGLYKKCKEKAITCLVQAIRQEPATDVFWVALGDAHFATSAKTAQHAYIKALEIDNKNSATWTNLGLLYLYHKDVELANEALYRAQILDPDYARAWVGQALVATANGHNADTLTILEHAIGLTANLPEADLEFSYRTFQHLRGQSPENLISPSEQANQLLPIFSALDRYCAQRPNDPSGLHLFGLVCERLGHNEAGAALIERAMGLLEVAYEETEDVVLERKFVVANANVARLRLASGDTTGAEEAWETVLGLLSGGEGEEDEAIVPDESKDIHDWRGQTATRKLRAQAQLGTGLARFMSGNLEGAVEMFEAAEAGASAAGDLETRGHVKVLLAQALWALRTNEFREAAKTQLLDCISTDPGNLTAITTLAGMGILDADENLIDASLSEIISLPLDQRRALDPRRDVDYLLTQHHLGQANPAKALTSAQSSVFALPSDSGARIAFARLCIQQGLPHAALAILNSSVADTNASNPLNEAENLALRAVAIARTCRSDEKEDRHGARRKLAICAAQHAIMLSPAVMDHWRVLAYVRSVASTE